MLITNTHIYFYSKTCFSNWHKSTQFDLITKIPFKCSEQHFFWYKADFFKDLEIRNNIANLDFDPGKAKELGRNVRGFNQHAWDAVKFGFMVYVCYCKFNFSILRDRLSETGSKILVEASPTDLIWGVGLGENDSKITDDKNWLGQNLLGKALMEVRKTL